MHFFSPIFSCISSSRMAKYSSFSTSSFAIKSKSSSLPFLRVSLYGLFFAILLLANSNPSSAAVAATRGYSTMTFHPVAEPSFIAWPPLPINSRAFVGIRTLPASKAIFGARQLKERLAEQVAEQRREHRQATEAIAVQTAAEAAEQNDQEQRRQRIYDRLLCMAALQNLAQCKDI